MLVGGKTIFPAVVFLTGLVLFGTQCALAADDVKINSELIDKMLERERRRQRSQGDPATPLISRAVDLFRARKYEQALEILHRARSLYPRSALAYYNLAWVYGELEQWEKSLDYSRAAVSLDPDLADAYFLTGLAFSELNRYEEAAAAYQKAIAKNPKSDRSYNNLGNALLFLKQHEAAVVAYRRAIELNPRDAEHYHNLAEAYRQTGRHADAIRSYLLAIENRPDFAAAYAQLADCYIALKEYESAMDALSSALKLEAGHPEWMFNLAVLALRFNRRKIAEQQLSELKKMRRVELAGKLTVTLRGYDEALVRLFERKEFEFTQALVSNDAKVLERFMSDDYSFSGFNRTSSREREIKRSSLLFPGAEFESITPRSIKVRQLDEEVFVTGEMTVHTIRGAQPMCGRFSYERVYRYEQKRWQIVSERIEPLYKKSIDCDSTSNYVKQLRAENRRSKGN
jgi:tetratricopeptide (TPR) repeat protein